MTLRFPRTIRLDGSDINVFDHAADPGEWSVPGGFEFMAATPDSLSGKAKQAFGRGWLGLSSLGRSTLVEVADIEREEYEATSRRLTALFIERYGAPDVLAAAEAARIEAEYAASLCEYKVRTLLMVEREFGEDGVIERFRVAEPPRPEDHAKIWTIDGD